ncbi:unnamed protein product, partial [Mesorhabditis spiculigera]
MSSEWSQWSPWSFCSANVRVRVRACSTVRGFKCIGHNKEFESCDTNAPTEAPKAPDYEGFDDPYSEDRKIAMSQLANDHEKQPKIKAQYQKVIKTRPAIPTPKKNILLENGATRVPFVDMTADVEPALGEPQPTLTEQEETELLRRNQATHIPVMSRGDLQELDERIASLDDRDDEIPQLRHNSNAAAAFVRTKTIRSAPKTVFNFVPPVGNDAGGAKQRGVVSVMLTRREPGKTETEDETPVLSDAGARSINHTMHKIGGLLQQMEYDAKKMQRQDSWESPDLENMSPHERRIYMETRTLEEKLKLVQKQMHKPTDDEALQKGVDSGPFVEGDTARALSWMIANMTRELSGHELPIVDIIPLEVVKDDKKDKPPTAVRKPDSKKIVSDTVNVEFVSPQRIDAQIFNNPPNSRVEKAFGSRTSLSDAPLDLKEMEHAAEKLDSLIGDDTKHVNRWAPPTESNDEQQGVIIKWKWSRWSDWSRCDCGMQKRKRVCIPKRSRRPSDIFEANGEMRSDAHRPSSCDDEIKQHQERLCQDLTCQ